MTDSQRSNQTTGSTEGPLFQGQEEQERIYSPQQVPGTDIPAVEQDADGTAAQGSAVATDPDADTTTATSDPNISHT